MTHDDISLIFLTLHGSRAYGTSTPESDWDLRGVGVAPITSYFGTRPWKQLSGADDRIWEMLGSTSRGDWVNVEDAMNRIDMDCDILNVTNFIRLAADANPNILDILFAHPEDWLKTTPTWMRIWKQRHDFLSMRVKHTYTGYAMSQLKRIKSHRKWLLEPPKKKPVRADFGLPEGKALVPKNVREIAESFLRHKQEEWALDALMESLTEDQRLDARAQLLGYFEMVHGRPYNVNEDHEQEQAAIQVGMEQDLYKKLEQERAWKSAMSNWKKYQGWLVNRNEARAKLESDFGYDTKHASHLVRLLLSVQEIMKDGTLSVRHPQAELLREVRNGAWSYDQLIIWAEEQDDRINELARTKPLPKAPDRDKIDELITDIVLDHSGYGRKE